MSSTARMADLEERVDSLVLLWFRPSVLVLRNDNTGAYFQELVLKAGQHNVFYLEKVKLFYISRWESSMLFSRVYYSICQS